MEEGLLKKNGIAILKGEITLFTVNFLQTVISILPSMFRCFSPHSRFLINILLPLRLR